MPRRNKESSTSPSRHPAHAHPAQPNNKSNPPPRTRPPGPYRSRHFGWKSNGKSRGQVPAASSRKQARAHRQRRPWRGRADAEAAVCRMEGRTRPRHGRIPRGGRPMSISWEARGARPTAARTSGGRPTVMLGRGGDDSRTRVARPRGRARCRGAREGRNKPPHNRKGGRPTDNTTLDTRELT